MERESRTDLIKTLEKEREKIHRYETKLKDLVAAYKSQVKENETLQATVKSLRASKTSYQTKNLDDGEQSTSEGDLSEEEKNYQQELERLTNSMTEIMEEKKLIQTAAIAERKALKQEYTDKIEQLTSKCDELSDQCNEINQHNAELKKKLRTEQMEREKEQVDHAAILRELNKNINDRMTEKDDLKHQLKDLQRELEITSRQPDQSENYEVIIADLTGQLQEMQLKVKDHENKANQQLMLGELQHQILDIKKQHAQNIVREQLRADEAEGKLGEIASKSEVRISELENKVSQLSDMVGNYEKLRFVDQQSIQKLKERVTQLDIENTALAKVANPEPDTNLNIEEITEKIRQLKNILRNVCEADQSTDYHIKLGEIFLDETRLHKKCDEEYNQLKEEFERYKLRAQSVLKNKTSKDHVNNREVEDMKNTIIELKEKLRLSADRHLAETQVLHNNIDELRQSITNLHLKHKQELSIESNECEQKVLEAEQRLHQHRDRTISLLAEKDEEIESLREKLRQSTTGFPSLSQSQDAVSPVEQLFTTEQTPHSGQLIHIQQEIARNNQEIASLRKQKYELEVALNDMQSNTSSKQEHYEEQIAFLKEEIHRLDRNKSREGINLEYLKNIVYRYMIATDPVSKQSIFNAISTILHFSPTERKTATQHMTT